MTAQTSFTVDTSPAAKRNIRPGSVEIKRPGLGSVYTYERGPEYGPARFIATAYTERSYRHSWSYAFRTEAQRTEKIESFFAGLQAWEDAKTERRQTRATFAHTLKVGDILENSWGYEQTNIDFYQIVRLVGKQSIVIRPIASKHHAKESSHWLTGYVVPDVDHFTGPEMTKRVQASSMGGSHADGLVSFEFGIGVKWDGQPSYYTAYA
jgi:hypothetical protein